MGLTPLDIRQQQFKKTLWGFDAPEVDAFLDVLAHDFEQLNREVLSLRDEVHRKDAEVADHRDREKTLKDTMITATRIAEDIKDNARKEAEIVIAKAESQAEQIIQNAHTRLVRIVEDIDELRRQRAQFEAVLRSTIASHSKLMDAMNERDAPVDIDGLSLLRRQTEPASGAVVALNDSTSALPPEPDLLTPRGGDR